MFSIQNRGELQASAEHEFENFASRSKALWLKEHNEDGTHAFITAQNIEVAHPTTSAVSVRLGNAIATLVAAEEAAGILMTGDGLSSTSGIIARVMGPDTFRNSDDYPTVSVTSDIVKLPMTVVGDFVPFLDGTYNLGYQGDTTFQMRWKSLYFSKVVHGPKVVATTAFYERARGIAVGDWQDITYNDNIFTGNATGDADWVVDVGDVSSLRYTRIGTTVILNFSIRNTDVANAPTQLRITIPATIALVSGGRFTARLSRLIDAGVVTSGRVVIDSTTSTTLLLVVRDDGAAFTNTAADNTDVEGQITFEAAA